MANPFPFTAGQVLTAAQMNGIGEATIAYTPTVTNFTTGNGSVAGYFTRVNKLVYGSVTISLGSTSAITGVLSVTFPVTAAANSASLLVGSGFYFDTSTGETYTGFSFRGSSTTFTPIVQNASATYAARTNITATTPVAFATGDGIFYTFCYEAA